MRQFRPLLPMIPSLQSLQTDPLLPCCRSHLSLPTFRWFLMSQSFLLRLIRLTFPSIRSRR